MLSRARNIANVPRDNFPERIQQSTDFLKSLYNDIKDIEFKYFIRTMDSLSDRSEREKHAYSNKAKSELDSAYRSDTFPFVTDLYLPNFTTIDDVFKYLNKIDHIKKLRIPFYEILLNHFHNRHREVKNSIYKIIVFILAGREKPEALFADFDYQIYEYFENLSRIFTEKCRLLEYLEIDSITLNILTNIGNNIFPYLRNLRILAMSISPDGGDSKFSRTFYYNNLIASELKSIHIQTTKILTKYNNTVSFIINQDNLPNLFEIKNRAHFFDTEDSLYESEEIDENFNKNGENYIYMNFIGDKNFSLADCDFLIEKAKKPFVNIRRMPNHVNMDLDMLKILPNVENITIVIDEFTGMVSHGEYPNVVKLNLFINKDSIFDGNSFKSFPNIKYFRIHAYAYKISCINMDALSDLKDLEYVLLKNTSSNLNNLKNFFMPLLTSLDFENIIIKTNFDFHLTDEKIIVSPEILNNSTDSFLKKLFNSKDWIRINFLRWRDALAFEELRIDPQILTNMIDGITNGTINRISLNIYTGEEEYDENNDMFCIENTGPSIFFDEDALPKKICTFRRYELFMEIVHRHCDYFNKFDLVELGIRDKDYEPSEEITLGDMNSFSSFNRPIRMFVIDNFRLTIGKYASGIPNIEIIGKDFSVNFEETMDETWAYNIIKTDCKKDIVYEIDFINDIQKPAKTIMISYGESEFVNPGIWKKNITNIIWNRKDVYPYFTHCSFNIENQEFMNNISEIYVFDRCVFLQKCVIRNENSDITIKYLPDESDDDNNDDTNDDIDYHVDNLHVLSTAKDTHTRIKLNLKITGGKLPVIEYSEILGKFELNVVKY